MGTITYPRQDEIDLVLLGQQSGTFSMGQLIESVTWTRSWDAFADMFEVNLLPFPGLAQLMPVTGYYVIRSREWGEIGRGRDLKSDPSLARLEIYSPMRALTSSEDDLSFPGIPAISPRSATITLLERHGIPYGTIAEPGVLLERVIFRGAKLSDMILNMYTRARARTGKRYSFRDIGGQLNILEIPNDPDSVPDNQVWVFRRGENIIEQSGVEYDATKVITQSKVRGTKVADPINVLTPGVEPPEPEEIYAVASAGADSIRRFGLVQKLTGDTTATDQATAQAIAQQILDWNSLIHVKGVFQTFGVPTLWPGDIIYLDDPIVGVDSRVYVSAIGHEISGSGGNWIMTVYWTIYDPMEEWFENLEGSERAGRRLNRKSAQNILEKIAAQASLTGYPVFKPSTITRR